MWFDKYYLNVWTRGGRSFPKLDCWGLVCDVYRDKLNIELDEHTNFTEQNMSSGLLVEQVNFYKVEIPQNYDVACWIVNKQLKHVGIVFDGHILHCDRKVGTVYQAIPTNCKNIYFYRHRSN